MAKALFDAQQAWKRGEALRKADARIAALTQEIYEKAFRVSNFQMELTEDEARRLRLLGFTVVVVGGDGRSTDYKVSGWAD